MGEAKRRGTRPPTDVDKARRWIVRVWLGYPKWFRTIYIASLKVNGIAILLFAGLLLSVVIAWLLERLLHVGG